jgi:hypothetical protein
MIVYAVNTNHTRERHLDGTVLSSGADGTVFNSLARPDLFTTDAERANVHPSVPYSRFRTDHESMLANAEDI